LKGSLFYIGYLMVLLAVAFIWVNVTGVRTMSDLTRAKYELRAAVDNLLIFAALIFLFYRERELDVLGILIFSGFVINLAVSYWAGRGLKKPLQEQDNELPRINNP